MQALVGAFMPHCLAHVHLLFLLPHSLTCPVSGTVADLSTEAAKKSGLKLGDPVFALVGGGGYAGMRCTSPSLTVAVSPHLHPSQ